MAKITLGGQEIEIARTNRADFRLGSLATIPNIGKPHQTFAAICVYLWAMLPKELHSKYPTPEDVAEDMPTDKIGETGNAILDTYFPLPDSGKVGSVKKDSSGKRRKSASKPV